MAPTQDKTGARSLGRTSAKRIIVIAGPNGAGKTMFATEFLPNEADCPRFVNADLIAAGLSPFRPELAAIKAGRLMLQAIADYVARDESFAFETTLAGVRYAWSIPRRRAAGYRVSLIFCHCPMPTWRSRAWRNVCGRVSMPFQWP